MSKTNATHTQAYAWPFVWGEMERRLHLQPRLRLLAEMVPPSCRHLADIGTDHGYLPVWLLQRGRIESAIAADIGEDPLAHARRTAAEYGVEGIDFRLCDGLAGIESEDVDTVVIAGMGGETIIGILSAAPWTKDGEHTLLLQPMTKGADLRHWLSVNGYRFTEERLVRDKNYLYPVLRVTGGAYPELSEVQAVIGVLLDSDPLYGEYLDQHSEKLRRAAEGLRRSGREDALHRAREMELLVRQIEKKRDTL